MKKYASLLRGINVGGKHKILMKDLTALYETIGLVHVKSYIQSGNLVFSCSNLSITEIENLISTSIHQHYGFDVPVIVREKGDWQHMIDVNPYKDNDPQNLFITFLKEQPKKDDINKLSTIKTKDQFSIVGSNAYLLCEGKYHLTKLSNRQIEKQLNSSATTRNWNTILKINDLLLQ